MDQFTRRIIGFGLHAGIIDGAPAVALGHFYSGPDGRRAVPGLDSYAHCGTGDRIGE